MQTLTDIRIYTNALRYKGEDITAMGVHHEGDSIYVTISDGSVVKMRLPMGVCECEPQPIPEPTPRCDNSSTNVLATLLRGADGKGVVGGYFDKEGNLFLKMDDGSAINVGQIDLSNYYTKSEVDGKRLPNPWELNYSFNGASATYDGSMRKYLPSIYAPSSAGKKGQILSSNGAGEPVWVDTPSLSGTEVKWEDIQNKPTTIKGFGITDTYTKQDIEDKGYLTEDEIPRTLPNPQALEITVDGVRQSYNGNKLVQIGVTTPKEADVAGWGFTKNMGTVIGVRMNGVVKGNSGVVDLGTVLTEHQEVSAVAKSGDYADLINAPTEIATATQRNTMVAGASLLSLQPNILYDWSGSTLDNIALPALRSGDAAYDNKWMVRLALLSSANLTIPFEVKWRDGIAPSWSSWCICDITFRKDARGMYTLGEWKIYK